MMSSINTPHPPSFSHRERDEKKKYFLEGMQGEGWIILFLVLASCLLFFYKLGSFSLYDAIETIYGEFVKGILQTDDWLTLHFNGQIIFDKPPLYFWLVALISKLIGFNEFSMRFWAALSGVLTVLTTYALGKVFYNQRTGLFSAIITMTALQFIVQSRIAELDIVLTLCLCLSLCLFYQGYSTNQRQYYLFSWFPMGFALLIKGILGVALPLSAIFFFLLFKKELPKIKEMFPLIGLAITALIGLPWYLAEYLIHGKVFADFALGFLFLSRFQGAICGHTGPWYYYFLVLLLGFAPWSQFLPLGIWQAWKNRRHDPELLLLCLIIPTFMMFSVAKTKIPNYILPLFPFLAIMVGKLWSDYLDRKQNPTGMKASGLCLLIVVLLFTIAAIIAGGQYAGPYQTLLPHLYWLISILTFGSLISVVLLFTRTPPLYSFVAVPLTIFAFVGALTTFTLPAVEPFKGTKELALEVSKVIKPHEQIAAYDIGNRPGVVFYNSRPVIFLKTENSAINFLKKKSGYCFTQSSNLDKLMVFGEVFDKKGELAVLH